MIARNSAAWPRCSGSRWMTPLPATLRKVPRRAGDQHGLIRLPNQSGRLGQLTQSEMGHARGSGPGLLYHGPGERDCGCPAYEGGLSCFRYRRTLRPRRTEHRSAHRRAHHGRGMAKRSSTAVRPTSSRGTCWSLLSHTPASSCETQHPTSSGASSPRYHFRFELTLKLLGGRAYAETKLYSEQG